MADLQDALYDDLRNHTDPLAFALQNIQDLTLTARYLESHKQLGELCYLPRPDGVSVAFPHAIISGIASSGHATFTNITSPRESDFQITGTRLDSHRPLTDSSLARATAILRPKLERYALLPSTTATILALQQAIVLLADASIPAQPLDPERLVQYREHTAPFSDAIDLVSQRACAYAYKLRLLDALKPVRELDHASSFYGSACQALLKQVRSLKSPVEELTL